MAEETRGSASASLSLPDAANLDWLRKQAKRLRELQKASPDTKLAAAQFELAKQYGFPSWRALKAHIDSLTVEGQLFDSARTGDIAKLTALLDGHPDTLHARMTPYAMTLLHIAAQNAQLAVADLLLRRGIDANVREKGDNTYPMHWAAAGGWLDVVRRLADAGGDVVGRGDDHELEVIGWATCWDGCDDDAHRAVVDFLTSRGARHHIFSAIAMNLADDVRRIVAAEPAALTKAMSHNENFQRPLHFAVRKNRPEMVTLLLELGADPLAADGTGYPASAYAVSPDSDRAVLEAMRARGTTDLFVAVALHDWALAERLLREMPAPGALHLMARRGDATAVKWLLDHGVDPNARWDHWGAMVTPLHLAAMLGRVEIIRLLLDAGGDPDIHDSLHDGDAAGWAYYSGHPELVDMLTTGI
ncbi:MAG: ankyrin repeat domain-containing protein [Gemmatimonadota bacterium]|nr:ankyrin repeat domain-containing protein [Gemmatimonadota bacterium]